MAYQGEDLRNYQAGWEYLPQKKYSLDYTLPTEEEETVTQDSGITNTNAFTNSGGGGGGPFDPYTAQPYGSYVTNRSTIGNTGYLKGTEPEENYLNKIGGLIKTGIGMAIPGGNFLMGMADNLSRENRLNAADNAFIDMQLGIQEKPFHGHGNLTNQDYYGYNKVSMSGNYADLVSKLADEARAKNPEDLTNFNKYYLEKDKEQDDIDKQIDFNNWMNQRITANNLRKQQELGIETSYKPDIHGGDETPTTTDGDGGSYTPPADPGTTGSWTPGGTYTAPAKQRDYSTHKAYGLKEGGRIGLAPGGPAGGASAGGDYGGNVNQEQEYAGRTFEETYRGNNEPPTKNKLSITPYTNVEEDKLRRHVPVDIGFAANTKRARLLANLNLRNLNNALMYGKEDRTVINSWDDVKNLIEPSLDLSANVNNLNLGYTTNFDDQNTANISYAPNENLTIGAATDFDNINLGATYNKGPFTVGGTMDDMGNWNTRAGLEWAFNNGGLVGLL